MGADLLLIDEDTCATNFMIRDDKMMQLVAPDKEPITPFVRVVRSLYTECGISSVMVIGGVGDFFDVADEVVMLDSYKCLDVTERAKQIVANSIKSTQLPHTASASVSFGAIRPRYIVGSAYLPDGKVKVASQSVIAYGETELVLSGLEQLVAKSQTSAISNALQRISSLAPSAGESTLPAVLLSLDKVLDEEGLDALTIGQFHGGMSRPRRFEIAGAINRLRREKSIIQTR
jgi:predicted ABC-class ATPase